MYLDTSTDFLPVDYDSNVVGNKIENYDDFILEYYKFEAKSVESSEHGPSDEDDADTEQLGIQCKYWESI